MNRQVSYVFKKCSFFVLLTFSFLHLPSFSFFLTLMFATPELFDSFFFNNSTRLRHKVHWLSFWLKTNFSVPLSPRIRLSELVRVGEVGHFLCLWEAFIQNLNSARCLEPSKKCVVVVGVFSVKLELQAEQLLSYLTI